MFRFQPSSSEVVTWIYSHRWPSWSCQSKAHLGWHKWFLCAINLEKIQYQNKYHYCRCSVCVCVCKICMKRKLILDYRHDPLMTAVRSGHFICHNSLFGDSSLVILETAFIRNISICIKRQSVSFLYFFWHTISQHGIFHFSS